MKPRMLGVSKNKSLRLPCFDRRCILENESYDQDPSLGGISDLSAWTGWKRGAIISPIMV